jgi:hypothetical protein
LDAVGKLVEYRGYDRKQRTEILMDSLAENRRHIEQNVPKIMACLWDTGWDVRFAALDAIEKLMEYRE